MVLILLGNLLRTLRAELSENVKRCEYLELGPKAKKDEPAYMFYPCLERIYLSLSLSLTTLISMSTDW
jgi:hypothetical protein